MTRSAVPRTRLLYASLLLCAASAGHAQSAPANVVTPAPPPREGTVGPEQLRDFSLPGTRTSPEPATPAPPAEQTTAPPRQAPTPAPPAAREPAPAPAPRSRSETVSLPAPAERRAPTQTRPDAPSAGGVTVDLGAPTAIPSTPATPSFEALPVPTLPSSSPPLPSLETTETGTPWWPWAVAAALGLLALALVWRRQRPRLAFAAPGGFEDAPDPSPPPDSDALSRARPPAEPASEPPLPAGLVTTRLRSSKPAPLPPPPARPQESQAPVGAVVSTRLRPFIDLNLAAEEVVLDEQGALLRLRLTVGNVGTAAARDIVIEALPLNAGEAQSAEISAFHQRPATTEQGIAELPRLASTEIVHEVRMPRGAMREYEVQGRRLFVPILAFNAHYRWSQGTGHTGAAFLLGHERRDSERLAPLRLDGGAGRLTGIGVRRLEDAVRR